MKTIKELITDFKNYSDLSYYETGCEYIDLYINDKFKAYMFVWLDSEMNDREYIIINNEIIYLDTLECLNAEDLDN